MSSALTKLFTFSYLLHFLNNVSSFLVNNILAFLLEMIYKHRIFVLKIGRRQNARNVTLHAKIAAYLQLGKGCITQHTSTGITPKPPSQHIIMDLYRPTSESPLGETPLQWPSAGGPLVACCADADNYCYEALQNETEEHII